MKDLYENPPLELEDVNVCVVPPFPHRGTRGELFLDDTDFSSKTSHSRKDFNSSLTEKPAQNPQQQAVQSQPVISIDEERLPMLDVPKKASKKALPGMLFCHSFIYFVCL